MKRLWATAVALWFVGLLGGALPTHAANAPPRVTMIGDSVAASLEYTDTARAILAHGVDLRLEMAPCRRVGQASCSYQGARPLTVIDLVPTLGDALGQTVVVAVGYNDYEAAYPGDIEDALAVFRKAGVTRVLWLTLHEARPAYAAMNDAIHAAAARHQELTVVDWQLYSRSHPDWFQEDGIHLKKDGAEAMATLVHNTLVDLGIAPSAAPASKLSIVASQLPVGVVGKSYSGRLVARGGNSPYRWTRVRGRIPVGLRLLANGRLVGVPMRAGSFSTVVSVTDASHTTTTRTIRLRVRSR